ncbi:MAG: addiction module protein [Candidatus Competibacteraceae bacterium]
MPLEKLEVEALELPVRERAHLARRLIESLDTDVTEDLIEVEREWEAEIQRRLKEYRSGKAQPIPASQVMAEARSRQPQ